MKSIKYALINIKMNFKNAKELKSAFIITIIGMAVNNIAFLLLWYYYGKTIGEVNGWAPLDIFGLYGFNCISYGIVVGFFNGIFYLPNYISTGNFDKYLLTPKNILLKVSTSKISTAAMGDLLFGIICSIIFMINNKLSILKILLYLGLTLITSVLFYSVSLFCMSISFYLMDGENVSNGLYGLFFSNSLYHGGSFTGILRVIFVFIIPSLLLGAIQVEIIKTLSISKLIVLIELSIFWLIASIIFFYHAKKKYDSNNLFGFGG